MRKVIKGFELLFRGDFVCYIKVYNIFAVYAAKFYAVDRIFFLWFFVVAVTVYVWSDL